MSENWSQSHIEVCARQVRGRQTVQTFSQRVKAQTDKFLVLDKRLDIEYMYYLKKLSMFPVHLVDICKFF